ncbi:diuretic hormone receptor-like isoform X2 [Toxorhynchites rutilus septentrionalis]|uniref:diuretic hormone receptor-like isoform X2 n=1 Tax=Toxorhynchites rutilus septentrionalis TaxID=329112 RepID=UPI0024795C5E|nr:diuretic hormone receptor-like isoform X2 [Toxorhynchites rutilus septentrionalis]
MIQAHLVAQAETPFDGCPVDFDRILCWPRTESDTWAVLPCFEEFKGVHYDSTQNATRYCHPNGKWDNYSHYAACHHMTEPPPNIVEITSIIYYTGYIISLIALSLAVIVFVYFKDLRCLRNTIHANLFITYILSALLWMVILTLQLSTSSSSGMTSCVIFVTLLHYFTLTNFFWMLVEGLYLYMLVVETFSGDNLRFNMYAAIGWGGPGVFVVLWVIAKGIAISGQDRSAALEIECSWMRESLVDWIFQGPVCAVLIINLVFLIRIMWVLITKLRSANTVETRQYRKASKALLVLIPLLGITYLVVLAAPAEGVVSDIFAVARALLLSTQGFSVSLFYCFLNSEVRLALRHRLERWRDERNIRLGQVRQRSRRPQAYNKRESCASSATTTTLLGPPMGAHSNYPNAMRGSNGALHMHTLAPRAISPLIMQGLSENSV